MNQLRAGILCPLGVCAIAAASCASESQPTAEVVRDTTLVEADFATTPQIRRALSVELAEANEALVSLEQSIYLVIGDTLAINLRAVHDRWTEYRQGECETLAAMFAGGSYAPVAELVCLVVLTEDRNEFLVDQYEFIPAVGSTTQSGGGAGQP